MFAESKDAERTAIMQRVFEKYRNQMSELLDCCINFESRLTNIDFNSNINIEKINKSIATINEDIKNLDTNGSEISKSERRIAVIETFMDIFNKDFEDHVKRETELEGELKKLKSHVDTELNNDFMKMRSHIENELDDEIKKLKGRVELLLSVPPSTSQGPVTHPFPPPTPASQANPSGGFGISPYEQPYIMTANGQAMVPPPPVSMLPPSQPPLPTVVSLLSSSHPPPIVPPMLQMQPVLVPTILPMNHPPPPKASLLKPTPVPIAVHMVTSDPYHLPISDSQYQSTNLSTETSQQPASTTNQWKPKPKPDIQIIQQEQYSRLVGYGGKTINSIRKDSEATIIIKEVSQCDYKRGKAPKNYYEVHYSGTTEQVKKAKDLVKDALETLPKVSIEEISSDEDFLE